jgi:hypothetical protein
MTGIYVLFMRVDSPQRTRAYSMEAINTERERRRIRGFQSPKVIQPSQTRVRPAVRDGVKHRLV